MLPVENARDLKPTDDNVVIEKIGTWPDLGRESELIIVSEKAPIEVGEVLAVGPGRFYFGFDQTPFRSPMDVEVGNVVMFGRYAGARLDDDHVILKHGEIIGIYDGELPNRG